MINSNVNKYKRLKVDTEGELQQPPSASTSSVDQNLSEYQGIKKQLNIIECDINQQTINIQCNSANFTTDLAILETVTILFPIPNEVFAGRDSEFDEIEEYLTKHQIAVICGMAGIGKTECSKKFAWNNSARYRMKLWINTDSEENIQKSVYEIGRKLSIDVDDRDVANIIKDIYDYFENRKIFSLFVFDNANDRRSINNLLPFKIYHNNSFIHIIITSQNKKWGKYKGKNIPVLELNPLEIEFSVDVFREIIEDKFDDYELALWENLAYCVNQIPLALQVTAAYIKNEIESIEEFGIGESFCLRAYTKKLEDELHLIIDEPFPDDSENAYPKTVYIAISMTLEKVKLQSAFDMLYAISYLSPDHINHDLFLILMTEEEIRKSIEILSKFSLINTNNYKRGKKIGIHRLVQWVLRYHQEKAGREVQILHFNKIFTTILNNDPRFFNHYFWILKHELNFKETIRDYFILNSDFSKIKVIIEYEAINSLLLICESLERSNIKDPIDWITIALQHGAVESFLALLKYLEKVNNELKCFKTMNDGILFLFIMHLKEFAENKFVDTFRMLLKRCTDVNVTDGNGFGYTPIMLAAHRCFDGFVHLLLETNKVDLNRADKMGWTVYHYLIGAFHLCRADELSPQELGTLLINLGFNINVIDETGRSLLHHACKYVSASYIKFLIVEHKLDINLKDKNGIIPIFTCFEYTPETLATESPFYLIKNEDNLIECIDVLTKNGVDVNAVNEAGQTILHLAAKFYPTVVQYLINTHNMDVNAKDKLDVTVSSIIRDRDPCYDDVELSKQVSRIVFYEESEKNMFMKPSYLTWTLNLLRYNFEDFTCSYNEISSTEDSIQTCSNSK